MTPSPRFFSALLLAAPLAAPAAVHAATPIKVTRFHLNGPIAPGSVQVVIAPDATIAPGPEAAVYTDAVANAAVAAGFTRAADPAASSDYRLVVTVSRQVDELPPAPPPLSIGLGGGGGDRGGGVGGAVSFGVGKRQPRAQVTTQLSVRMTRGAQAEVVWEGRAVQSVEERGKLVQPGEVADKLAKALFRGFPGESGRTISVK